jgi:hypothetical protein
MNELSKNGITAYITELDNGNFKVEIEGIEGSEQFTEKQFALDFIEIQFQKACS